MKQLFAKLSFALGLVVALLLCGWPAGAGAQAIAWRYGGMKSFEAQHPGLGVSHRYSAAEGWIDVYVYGLQRNDWKPGTADAQFGAHFESTIAEVNLYAQRGLYVDLQVGESRDVEVGGQAFRTIGFQFTRDGRRMHSATYLTARNGQLLKYRVSLYAAGQFDIDAVAQQFIEEHARSGAPERKS